MEHKRIWSMLGVLSLLLPAGCGGSSSTDAGVMPDGGEDAGARDAGPPPVPGCANPRAANHDPEATVNDGSCVFTVTFAVDMTAYEYDREAGIAVRGTFCTSDCPTLSDTDGDDVWVGSADLTSGRYEHQFVLTTAPEVVETVPSFCRAEGATRRAFDVGDDALTLDAVAFAGCTVLPVVVDGFYAASGFFGDSGDIAVTEACPVRGGGGAGACRTWSYARGAMGFAGAFWQYPENNFGALPGFPMPRGATRISFSAWGAAGGEVVKFLAGFAPDASGARDGFARETRDITLTTTPTEYTISLVGVRYALVAGAFGWVAGLPDGAGPLTFYLDDVRWERIPEDLSSVPGCMDADASNHNPGATMDDGSCLYPVTFEVDMTCPDPAGAFSTVWVTGPFCSWCARGFPLADPDGDGVYAGTFDFPAGPLEHKFMVDNFASQENLIGDGACAPVTDGMTYANRQVTVDSMPTRTTAVYGRCAACP